MKIIEEIKDVIEDAKQNSTSENSQIVTKSFFKSILGLVPVFGDTAMEIYGELQSKQVERKIMRLEEFYRLLDSKIESVESQVNNEYINKDDFLDVFEEATKYVVLERHKEKRVLFKNILANSITSTDCDYDRTERYFRILDNLSEVELRILSVLDNPEAYNRSHGMIIGDPVNSYYQSSWREVTGSAVLTQLLGLKIHEVQEAVTVLFSYGLIVENILGRRLQTNGNAIHVLDSLLTVSGKNFVKYLKG